MTTSKIASLSVVQSSLLAITALIKYRLDAARRGAVQDAWTKTDCFLQQNSAVYKCAALLPSSKGADCFMQVLGHVKAQDKKTHQNVVLFLLQQRH